MSPRCITTIANVTPCGASDAKSSFATCKSVSFTNGHRSEIESYDSFEETSATVTTTAHGTKSSSTLVCYWCGSCCQHRRRRTHHIRKCFRRQRIQLHRGHPVSTARHSVRWPGNGSDAAAYH